MTDFIITDTHERLFALSAIELLAAVFRGPDGDGWAAIVRDGVPQLLDKTPSGASHHTATLENLQQSLPDQSEKDDRFTELETDYVRLFVAGADGVPAPPYESCHLGDAPRIMGDAALSMRSRLNECGLEVSLESNEPPDHIALEFEYLYHLLATAWSENRPELEAKGRDFARLDMLPWVKRFRSALAGADPHAAYLHAADLAVAVLRDIGG